MTVTVQKFIADFDEFATYPISKITMWLEVAKVYVDTVSGEWGSAADIGVEFVAAHNLVLDAAAKKAVAAGTLPVPTVLSSKAVGPVSAGYNTTLGMVPDGGNWNLTFYGTRFLELRELFGAGGVQL